MWTPPLSEWINPGSCWLSPGQSHDSRFLIGSSNDTAAGTSLSFWPRKTCVDRFGLRLKIRDILRVSSKNCSMLAETDAISNCCSSQADSPIFRHCFIYVILMSSKFPAHAGKFGNRWLQTALTLQTGQFLWGHTTQTKHSCHQCCR